MAIPPSLRLLVEQQWESLGPEDQQLLDSASVPGVEFSAASVAAGMEADLELVEERCAALQRRGQFLRVSGQEEWPDGTAARRYRFPHTVYQHVTYDWLFPVRRAQLHRRIGTRVEAAYRERLGERAGELARHFVEGRDAPRAARYLRLAAENALRRSGYHEAISHLRQGVDLLLALPEGLAREREELELRIMRVPP